uniref:Fibrinogen C-terminal domain-containing protein n=1 Tax=Anopheles atroparvus TaxID=41427 RepID=A0A182JID3_ANOAO
MVKDIGRVLEVIVFCALLPTQSWTEQHVPKTGAHEFQSEMLTAHLAAFEARLEAKLIARIEERLLGRIEDIAKNAKDAFEQRLGEIAARIDGLGNTTERAVGHLIQQTVLPKIETSVETARGQIVGRLTQALREETNQLEHIVNHPGVFRDALWIPIQHRFDGSTDFQRNWTEYRAGFGSPGRGEHWFGLERLYDLLRRRQHELLVVLQDFDGTIVHAHYGHFRIGGEAERYAIKTLGEYSGTAGDALRLQEGAPFSTEDTTGDSNSELSCATVHQGGWWFWKFPWCTKSNLNGKYYSNPNVACNMGLNWSSFRTCKYSLKSSKMMIRQSN